MPTKLQLQDFFSTTITEPSGIPASGDFDFTVAVAPQYTNGFIVISANNSTLRDVFYFHNRVGNRLYVRAEGRLTGGKAHALGESVQINDTANIFNYFSDMVAQAFFIEKTGGLTVRVNGGYVLYNGIVIAVGDQSLTLANNTTNYIKYDFPTNTISADTTNSGNIKAVVTTLSGVITSIEYRQIKEAYIDFTVAITGALPSQTGNAGKVLFTDGTNVSWGNVVIPIASQTVAGSVEMATQAQYDADGETGETGAQIVPTPLNISTNRAIQSVAGEPLTANDFVQFETQRVFAFSANLGLANPVNVGDISANTRRSIRLIGNGVSSNSLKLGLSKAGTPADSLTIRIETDDGSGKPSGTLAHANATGSVTGASLTATQTDTTVTFAGAFTLTNNTRYHIVAQRVTGVDAVNYYILGGYTRNVRGFLINSYNGTVWGTATGTMMPYVSYAGAYSSIAVKTNATNADNVNFVGCVTTTVTFGASCNIFLDGTRKTFSGLTLGVTYYLSDTPGAISTTPGTNVIPVGVSAGGNALIVSTRQKLTGTITTTPIAISGTSSIIEVKGGGILYIGSSSGITATLYSTRDGGTFDALYSEGPTPQQPVSIPLSKGMYRVITSGAGTSYSRISHY